MKERNELQDRKKNEKHHFPSFVSPADKPGSGAVDEMERWKEPGSFRFSSSSSCFEEGDEMEHWKEPGSFRFSSSSSCFEEGDEMERWKEPGSFRFSSSSSCFEENDGCCCCGGGGAGGSATSFEWCGVI